MRYRINVLTACFACLWGAMGVAIGQDATDVPPENEANLQRVTLQVSVLEFPTHMMDQLHLELANPDPLTPAESIEYYVGDFSQLITKLKQRDAVDVIAEPNFAIAADSARSRLGLPTCR